MIQTEVQKCTMESFPPMPIPSTLIPLSKNNQLCFPWSLQRERYAFASKVKYIEISLLDWQIADYIYKSVLYFFHIPLYPGPYFRLCWYRRAVSLANLCFWSWAVLPGVEGITTDLTSLLLITFRFLIFLSSQAMLQWVTFCPHHFFHVWAHLTEEFQEVQLLGQRWLAFNTFIHIVTYTLSSKRVGRINFHAHAWACMSQPFPHQHRP